MKEYNLLNDNSYATMYVKDKSKIAGKRKIKYTLLQKGIDENIIENFDIAVDIVYNPIETKFLKIAKEKNCIVVGGLYMLVGQAIKSQEIFNNINMDHKIIECIYEDLISHKLINQK